MFTKTLFSRVEFGLCLFLQFLVDRVSVPSRIAVDISDGMQWRGDRADMYLFERHIFTHITTSIKCYLVSLRYVYVPFTYILCQSNWYVYISTNFQNVNKPLTLHSYLQKKFLASKSSLITHTAIIDIIRRFESEYNNSPQFEIYTENRYM